jgi:uncharacterized protein YndB with AHSA1/START domain
MEYESIERIIEIDASPETVFEVITSPEHLAKWWPDEAELEATPGAIGHLVFGDRASPDAQIPEITVVDVQPPRLFSFRWVYPDGERAVDGNSLLVTFELTRRGAATVLHMSETGFRDRDWDDAMVAEQYREHAAGWDHFLPQLVTYATTVGATA